MVKLPVITETEDLNAIVDQWLPSLLRQDGTIDRVIVLKMVEEVERLSRQSIVSGLINVANMIEQRVDFRELARTSQW